MYDQPTISPLDSNSRRGIFGSWNRRATESPLQHSTEFGGHSGDISAAIARMRARLCYTSAYEGLVSTRICFPGKPAIVAGPGIHGYIVNLLRHLPGQAPANWQFQALVGADCQASFSGVSVKRARFDTEGPLRRILWEQTLQTLGHQAIRPLPCAGVCRPASACRADEWLLSTT